MDMNFGGDTIQPPTGESAIPPAGPGRRCSDHAIHTGRSACLAQVAGGWLALELLFPETRWVQSWPA